MKIFTDKDGNTLARGVPFNLDGLSFPANWLDIATPDDLEARGITMTEKDDSKPDQPAPSEETSTPAEPQPPSPIAQPKPGMTPEQKLGLIGLTVAELKALVIS